MSRAKTKESTGVPIVRLLPDRLTRAREEALVLELLEGHGYLICEMNRREERTSMLFRVRKGKTSLVPAQVVKLAVPDGSWLGQHLRRQRADKDTASAERSRGGRRRTANARRPKPKASSLLDAGNPIETRPAERAKRPRPRTP